MRRITVCVSVVCMLLTFRAQGQIFGTITGSVLDSSGAAIPNAPVVIKNLGTDNERVLKADSNGLFVAEALPVGTYAVTVSAAGFKSATRTGLQLNVADRLAVSFVLSPGEVTQSISVTAAAPLVNTETGDVSSLVTAEQLTDVSISNRTVMSVLQLIPGASRVDEDTLGVGFYSDKAFAINGAREKYTGLMVDGVQDTDPGSQNGMMVYPGMETLSEVKVLSSNYSAEYGTAGGANMLMVTRSGTKEFHGAAYEYLQNDDLDARNFFAPNRAELRKNNFGYRIGGPLFIPHVYNRSHEKTFFFFSQEWRRTREGVTIVTAVPTVAMREGDFSAEAARIGMPILDPTTGQPFPGNQIPASRLNKDAEILFNYDFLLPNTTGFNNFLENVAQPENYRQELVRVDHNFSDRTKLMFRFTHDAWVQTQPTTIWANSQIPSIGTITNVPGRSVVAKITEIVNPSLLTEVSFNYSNNYANFTQPAITLTGNYLQPPGLEIQALYPVPAGWPNKIPDLSFSGGWGNISTNNFPQYTYHAIVEADNNTTKIIGRHAIKFGAAYIFQRTPISSLADPGYQGGFFFSGTFTNDSMADFLLGLGTTYTQVNNSRSIDWHYHQLEPYVQDDWKVNSKLTLNLGLRYFFIPHAYEASNALTLFNPAAWNPTEAPTVLPNVTLQGGNPLNGIVGVKDGLPRNLVATHYNTFGPRFGFAYDLTGKGRTVLRGGYGIGYYRVEGNDLNNLTGNPPFSISSTVFKPLLNAPARGVGLALPGNLVTFDPVYDVPTVQTYSFGVQHELAANTALSVSYVGSRGTHLDRGNLLNYPLPANGYDFSPLLNTNQIAIEQIAPYRGWNSITEQTNTASSSYNSLQVQFTRALHNGLRFQAVYTFSKTITDADDFGVLPQDPYNLRAERSLASFDRTHVAVFNYIYELPFFRHSSNLAGRLIGGWELGGITAFQSGLPLTVGISTPTAGLATRPDVVPGQSVSGPKTVQEWFNTGAFQAPPFGFYGNAGRNTVRGPGIDKWDMSLFKNFKFREKLNFQFRAETFNTFNNVNFDQVSTTFGAGNFGQVVSARDPRIMQLGLKMEF